MSDHVDAPRPTTHRRRSWWGMAASACTISALLLGLALALRAQQSSASQSGYSRQAATGEAAPQSTAASSSAVATTSPSQNMRKGGEVYGFVSPQARIVTRQGEALAEQAVTQLVRQLLQEAEGHRDPETLGRLRELVEKQFDVRHQAQVARLEKVLADAKKAQSTLDRRVDRKDEIVERRIAELLGQSDPLNWDYPSTGPSTAHVSPYTYQIPVYSSPASPYATPPASPANRYPSRTNPAASSPASAPVQVPPPSQTQVPSDGALRTGDALPQRLEYTPHEFGVRRALQSQQRVAWADAAQSQDWIDAAFQYQNAQSLLEQRTQQLGNDHPELKGLEAAVAQSATRLELCVTDLKSQLEIANARLESARGQEDLLAEQLAEIESMYKAGLVKRGDILETQQQLLVTRERRQSTEIEIRRLNEQLEWIQRVVTDHVLEQTKESPVETGEKPSLDE